MELRCALCETSVPVNAYQDHQQFHSEDRVFSCQECGKPFSNSTDLKVHQHIHTVDGAIGCPGFGNSFLSSKNLKRHQHIHTVGGAFSCPECGTRGHIQESPHLAAPGVIRNSLILVPLGVTKESIQEIVILSVLTVKNLVVPLGTLRYT